MPTGTRKRKDAQNEPLGITRRLQSLAERHSLAEIARRTDTPTTCVHRYLHGSKVPVDFCERVVREFQVNPSWLLIGEGEESLDQVAERTGAMAGELLDLVRAMNAVAHQRMGALAGKHHARVLRELNDALLRYEELKGRIGIEAARIYSDLKQQLKAAMAKLDVTRAEELFRAADQVERLCFDEKISYEHLELQTNWALLTNDAETVLRNQQRLFREPISEGRLNTEEHCLNANRLGQALERRGRLKDALRVLRAALILAEEHAEELHSYPMLASVCGSYLIRDGQLAEGLALLQRWAGRVPEEPRRRAARHMLMIGLLMSSGLDIRLAFEWDDHHEIKALDLLQAALLLEDPEALQRAIDYYHDPRVEHLKVYESRTYLLVFAKALLAGMKSGLPAAKAELARLDPDTPKDAVALYSKQLDQCVGQVNRGPRKLEITGARLPLLMMFRAHLNVLRDPKATAVEKESSRAAVQQFETAGYEILRIARMRNERRAS
ncbi:MAG: hypothetical protein H6839_15905 [Planctomycetes bacterium]|nr:hypothetical protein [Planctomycetota bacterium]